MSEPHYLNIDLVISAREDLTPIVESFGQDVIVLFNGEWGEHYRAAFEIAGSHAAASEDIGYFCSLIEGLEDNAKDIWRRAFAREFDIGFESGTNGECTYTTLQASLLTRVAEARVSVTITLYPASPDEPIAT